MHPLEIKIDNPLGASSLTGQLALENGETVTVELRHGSFRGELGAPAVRLTLLSDAPKPALVPTQPASQQIEAVTPETVHTTALFERGVEISGKERCRFVLEWGGDCAGVARVDGSSRQDRFGTPEHYATAKYVGKARAEDGAPKLQLGPHTAPFDSETLLDVSGTTLRIGEIIGLAGDFYAHFDEGTATAAEFAWPAPSRVASFFGKSYLEPRLDDDADESIQSLRRLAHLSSAPRDLVREKLSVLGCLGRYLGLAANNSCHFASPEPGQPTRHLALQTYEAYHAEALRRAAQARTNGSRRGLHEALAVDAFGCHFLTDSFASGHLRTPRAFLADEYGVLRGALKYAKDGHDEDNDRGLWCTPRRPRAGAAREVWLACGDGRLLEPPFGAHLARVQEAVRRSVTEVFGAFVGEAYPHARRAAEMVPVPLPPGTAPQGSDDVLPAPGAGVSATRPNHWPLYWFDEEGRAIRRVSAPDDPEDHWEFADWTLRLRIPDAIAYPAASPGIA